MLALVFLGEPRERDRFAHAHESPWVMAVPMLILAVFAAGFGLLLNQPDLFALFFTSPLGPTPETAHAPLWVMAAGIGMAVGGGGLGIYLYTGSMDGVERLSQMFRPLHQFLSRQAYIDELYEVAVLRPVRLLAVGMDWWDRQVIDRIFVDGFKTVADALLSLRTPEAAAANSEHSGRVQAYLMIVTLAAIILSALERPMILSVLTFLPLVGAFALLIIPREKLNVIRGAAFAFSAATCLLSFWLWSRVTSTPGAFQFVEKHVWVARFGIHYFLGVDTLSMWMVLLTTVLSLAALVNAFGIEHRVKRVFVFFLTLETAMLGVFLGLDLFLFYVFWEMTLIPLYFLIGIWGGPRKEYAAIKFFLFTFFGSVFMLVALIAMYVQSPSHTFDFTVLAAQAPLWPKHFQLLIFLGLLIAFAVKIPAFPLHTWLPLAHVEAPTPVSVILAGVLLKMGAYGLIRFAFPLAPVAAVDLCYPLGIIAVINIVYGSLCALAQKDIKRMIAYSSVAHMGYVLLGIVAMNVVGFCGAVTQMVAHGLITGALFLLVGVIYDRTHSRDMDLFGGIGERMPFYTGCMLMASFASWGCRFWPVFSASFCAFSAPFGLILCAGLPRSHYWSSF